MGRFVLCNRGVVEAAFSVAALLGVGGCTLQLSLDEKKRQAAVAQQNAGSMNATLRRLLEADDPQVRSLVARELGEMGVSAAEAVPALHRLIEDPDRHVRFEAARALMTVAPEDRVAIPALMLIINDPQTALQDRMAAQTLLQQSGPKGQAALSLHNTTSTRPSPRPLDGFFDPEPADPEPRPVRSFERPPSGSSSRIDSPGEGRE